MQVHFRTCFLIVMKKLTWKESTLNHIKDLVHTDNPRFTFKELADKKLKYILRDTGSRTKSPERTLDGVLRELRDFKVLIAREDLGNRTYEYIFNNDNEELIYKERRSIGHIRVTKCLQRFKIKFEEEKTFEDLKHKSYLRLDIYFIFLKRKCAIEYDGVQHTQAVQEWGGEGSLTESQYRDQLKDDYCLDNGITLLRITHEHDIEHEVAKFLCQIIAEYISRTLLAIMSYILCVWI